MLFYFEVTDTFGGEANYCWVRRYKVSANSLNGAVRKVSAHEGFQKRLRYVGADRWNVQSAAICMFADDWGDRDSWSMQAEEL